MPHSAGRAQTPHSAGRAQPRRRTRGQESRGAPHHGAGGLALEDTRVLHPDKEWTNYEWRAWDKKHGHVLWMGSIQEDWTESMIAGFFLENGAKVTVTRKSRDNYCFVTFQTMEEAKDFMARHNHQPLSRGLGSDIRFNIRPRTRPRWFREIGDCNNGSGRGEGGYVQEDRLESQGHGGRQPPRGGMGRGSHEHRGAARLDPRINAGRGGRGRGRGGRGRMPFSQEERAEGVGRRMETRRIRHVLRGRSRSRSRSTSPLRSRSSQDSSSSSSDSSSSSSRGSSRDRRRYHSSFRQAPDEARQDDRGGNASGRGHGGVGLCQESDSANRHSMPSGVEFVVKNVRGPARAGLEGAADGSRPRPSDTEAGEVRETNHGGSSDERRPSTRVAPESASDDFASEVQGHGEPSILGDAIGSETGKQGVSSVERGASKDDVTSSPQDCIATRGAQNETALEDHEKYQAVDHEASTTAENDESSMVVDVADDLGKENSGGKGSRQLELEIPLGERDGLGLPASNAGRHDEPTIEAAIVVRVEGADKDCTGSLVEGESHLDQRDERGHVKGLRITGAPVDQGSASRESQTHTRDATSARVELGNETGGGDGVEEGDRCHTPETAEEKRQIEEARGRQSNRTPPPARSPPTHNADTGACAPSTCIGAPFCGTGDLEGSVTSVSSGSSGGKKWTLEPGRESEEKTTSSKNEAAGIDEGGDFGVGSRSGAYRDDRSNILSSAPSSMVGASSGSTATARQELDGVSPEARQSSPSLPGRGVKRRNMTDITLSQIIDHHMGRRRLNGPGEESSSLPHRDPSCRGAASSNGGGARLKGETLGSSHLSTSLKKLQRDGSAVVAAVWANGEILPLNSTAASHMRMVAPLLASEPEGRRVVIRTVSAVAAGAMALALPAYRLDVTGVCRDGLLLELSPNTDGQGNHARTEGQRPVLPTLAGRLQSAFDRLVALDLKLDTVRLPHIEALGIVHSGSSSEEFLRWRNDGTVNLLRLEPVPPAGIGVVAEVERSACNPDRLAGGVVGASEPDKMQFLGIDNDIGPLLPRTGLLESFNVDVYPMEPPLSGSAARENGKRSSAVVHLALILSDSGVFNSGGGTAAAPGGDTRTSGPSSGVRGESGHPGGETVGSRQLAARLGCVPPTYTAGGLAWRNITGLTCVADVSRLAFGSKAEIESKITLAEGLHTAQIVALAERVAAEGVLLVVLSGRQGTSADAVASRLHVELTIKGMNPAVLDTKTYLGPGALLTQVTRAGRSHVASNPEEFPSQQLLDSAALRRAVAALLGQARAGAGFLGMSGSGRKVGGGAGTTAAAAWQWCDVVIVHGSQALDVDLLPPGAFGLGPAEALSAYVDTVPQVCVDNLTPVNGSDVRMLRMLASRRASEKQSKAIAGNVGNGGGEAGITGGARMSFDTARFLEEWFIIEENEERLWRAFRASATIDLNTALPYDLNVLKPVAEPLLRLVKPPTSHGTTGGGDSRRAGDGCRSPTYALARSVLRLLQLCEALNAPPLPPTSVLFGLIERKSWT